MEPSRSGRPFLLVALSVFTVIFGGASALVGTCGPFTDVAADAFCPFVLEIFTLGITTGTTPTTYDPASNVSRLQMAAFLSRTVDGVVRRTSRRAALNQFWTQQVVVSPHFVGNTPQLLQSDGADIWVAVRDSNLVERRRASDGSLLEVWTGATAVAGVVTAPGVVLMTGHTSPGKLYWIIPSEPPGAVSTIATNLGANPFGIAYDGARFFTANNGPPGSVSIIPWPALSPVTVTTGFTSPTGAIYDGTNAWVTDGNLLKLDSNGAILQTVTVGSNPFFPIFDGSNIWVPNAVSNSISIVRPSTGAVLATLTGNGLNFPVSAAFDGERILVTNPGGSSVSLWKAASMAPIGTIPVTANASPFGACSDGVRFWITQSAAGNILQF